MPIKQPCMMNYLPKRNANVGRLEMFLVNPQYVVVLHIGLDIRATQSIKKMYSTGKIFWIGSKSSSNKHT